MQNLLQELVYIQTCIRETETQLTNIYAFSEEANDYETILMAELRTLRSQETSIMEELYGFNDYESENQDIMDFYPAPIEGESPEDELPF